MRDQSGQAQIVDYARRTGATVRDLARKVGGYGGLQMVGTAAQVADRTEEWLETRACDGFNVMFPFVPEDLDGVVDRLVPELQRRNLSVRRTRPQRYATISACRGRATASSTEPLRGF